MESAIDMSEVCIAWKRGRISASKARGLLESIAHDGAKIRGMDPRELGASESDTVYATLSLSPKPMMAKDVARSLGLTHARAAQMLCKLARRGLIVRVYRGLYARSEDHCREFVARAYGTEP